MTTQEKIEALKNEFPTVWNAARKTAGTDEAALADIQLVVRMLGDCAKPSSQAIL
jgi:hypothetical protein